MRLFLMVTVLFGTVAVSVFSQTNGYHQGNGTVLRTWDTRGTEWTIREHLQRIKIMDPSNFENAGISAQPNDPSTVRPLHLTADEYIDVSEIATAKNRIAHTTRTWLRITFDGGQEGWLFCGHFDPYEGGNGMVLKTIQTDSRTWTVRKLEDQFDVWKEVDVRNRPGLDGSRVLFKLIPAEDKPEMGVDSLAVTEETDTIAGTTDRWIKVKDARNRVGWIFGGYANTWHGGVRYRTPENLIESLFDSE